MLWELLRGSTYSSIYLLIFFHSKIVSDFMGMRSAFFWCFPWICYVAPLASFSTWAIISSKKLEVQLITDEDLPGPWPHQFEATNAQHKCILKAHVESEQSFHFEAMIATIYTVNMKNDRYSHWHLPEVGGKTWWLLLIGCLFVIVMSWRLSYKK